MWQEGPVPGELCAYPGYLMARLGQTSARRFARALEPLGLHPRHFGVMTILAAQPGISQQRLRDLTGIDASSMVAVIDELQERGLAERRPDPSDRRVHAIHLTPLARRTLEQARRRAAEVQDETFGALTPGEQRTLHELLRKLAASGAGSASSPASDTARAGRSA